MTDRRKFERAKSVALVEREQGRNELWRQVMATPIEARWKIDPSIYGRLSSEQLRRLLADTSGDAMHQIPNSPTGTRSGTDGGQVTRRRYREPDTFRRLWYGLCVELRAACVGTIAAMVGVFSLALLGPVSALVAHPTLVSRDASHWPPCRRLNRQVDACIYVIQKQLYWLDASRMLAIPSEALRTTNKHLSNTEMLGRGAVLVVWRNHQLLEQVR